MNNLFDKKDVISWANLEDAKKYIGEEGYFCDECREDLGAWHKGMLQDVDQSMPVDCIFEDEKNEVFGLFLPADKVKEVKKEKKYRPFSLEEFLSKFSIGTKISFRRRDITSSIYGLFEGYQTDKDETAAYHKIIICDLRYTLNELFERYEYLDEHGEWQPFGVLEK